MMSLSGKTRGDVGLDWAVGVCKESVCVCVCERERERESVYS